MSWLPQRKKSVGEWFSGALKGDFSTKTTDYEKTAKIAATVATTAAIGAAKVASAVEEGTKAAAEAAYEHGKKKRKNW